MDIVYVFYTHQNEQYELRFGDKTVFVEKDIWNEFINKQHKHKNNIVSLSSRLHVDLEDLERIIDMKLCAWRNKVIECIEITPPQISEETKLRMVEFFMKTSIPRIIAEEREKERSETDESITSHRK